MCSQIIAVMYLDKMNHYIKEKLKISKYIIYMDDGFLFSHDKNYLKYCHEAIIYFLKEYKLNVNIKKTRIDSIKNGVDFLGFKFYISNNKIIVKVRNDTKRRFKRKMKNLNKLYDNNLISDMEKDSIISSYIGHLSYGDCENLLFHNISRNVVDVGEEINIWD